MPSNLKMIEALLLRVLMELEEQSNVSSSYSSDALPFEKEMLQIRECIEMNEFGLAYETIVATVQIHPFSLTGKTAVALLEVGLLFDYKTERKADEAFDRRMKGP